MSMLVGGVNGRKSLTPRYFFSSSVKTTSLSRRVLAFFLFSHTSAPAYKTHAAAERQRKPRPIEYPLRYSGASVGRNE